MKKQFIIGYIAGALTFGVFGVLAAGLTAEPNPFPITLNNQNISMEGYNIEGSTYFKLRDISTAVGCFSVDFANDTIILTTDSAPVNTPVPTVSPTPVPTVSSQFKSEAGDILDDLEYEMLFLTQILPQINYNEFERNVTAALYRTEDMALHIEDLKSEYEDEPTATQFLDIAAMFIEADNEIYNGIIELQDSLFPDYNAAAEMIERQHVLMQASLEHAQKLYDEME